MTKYIKIFGYGSLINIKSLKETVPDAKSFFPALLENYIRIFETKATTRFTEQNIPVCVLNLKKNLNTAVNGICFKVTEEYFNDLLKREGAYELKNITVKSFATQKDFSAFVFIDKSNKKQDFLFDEPAQIDYLRTCLNGAKDFGDDFYKMFLENTLINGYKLKDIKKLNYLL